MKGLKGRKVKEPKQEYPIIKYPILRHSKFLACPVSCKRQDLSTALRQKPSIFSLIAVVQLFRVAALFHSSGRNRSILSEGLCSPSGKKEQHHRRNLSPSQLKQYQWSYSLSHPVSTGFRSLHRPRSLFTLSSWSVGVHCVTLVHMDRGASRARLLIIIVSDT